MCLGVPGKIIEIFEANDLKMAKVDFGGVVRDACLEYVPEAEVNEYVIIHVGFAIGQLSEQEAQETLRMIREMSELDSEAEAYTAQEN